MRDLIIMPGNYLPINETRPKIQPTLILFPLIFFSAAAFLPSPIFLPPDFLFYPKNPSNLPAVPRTHQPLTSFPLPQLWLFSLLVQAPPLSSLTSHHQLCCSPISSMASLLFCCPSNPASLQQKKGSPPPYFKKKCKWAKKVLPGPPHFKRGLQIYFKIYM